MSTIRTAAIYTRVSSDPRGQARSVAEQEAECRRVCEDEGWQVAQVFVDNDRSASRFATKDRPAFRRLLDCIDAGECDVVVTWESSRMQRDLAVFVELRRALMRRGVCWSYGGRTYDMSKARDRRETARDALDAEGASDETSERVQRAVRANAVAGRPHGKIPYGYQRTYDAVSGLPLGQVEQPEQAAIVRECAARAAAGEPLYAITKDLNARGVPGPRSPAWVAGQVKRLCVNPTYIAKRTHRGEVIGDALWPAILDEETFYACVRRLTDPSRRTNEGRGVTHLLSGIARCGVCGGAMRVLNNRTYKAYSCKIGFCVVRHQAKVDAFVTQVVAARLARPDLAELLLGRPNDGQDERGKIAELRNRLNGFYEAAAAGSLSPQALAGVEARLLPEIAQLETRLVKKATSPLIGKVAGPLAAETWAGLQIEQQRAIVNLLMRITLLPVGKGKRIFDPRSVQIDWRTS